MHRPSEWAGDQAGRRLDVFSTAGSAVTHDDGVELLIDVAERQAMLAVIADDAYAEVLIGPSTGRGDAGLVVEPPVMLRFPLRFAGIAG